METASPPHVLPFPIDDAPPVRGVRWVLAWAAATMVLGWAAIVLMAFACQLAAEQTLSQAVAAGLREATCDRATSRSVEQTIRRRLAEQGIATRQLSITTQHNGSPLSGMIRTRRGDRVSVSLSIPQKAVLPTWMSQIGHLGRSGALTVWADHTVAGI